MTLYIISDTHFCHANILTFKGVDGAPIRPFTSVDEMDEVMIDRWNATVRPQDHIYHLGDVTMLRGNYANMRPTANILRRLNGHKRLILGNHDHGAPSWYAQFFGKVRGSNVLEGLLLTHYPVDARSIGKARGNVHGHIHQNAPYPPALVGDRTLPYINVSVERINYTPVAIEDVVDQVRRLS